MPTQLFADRPPPGVEEPANADYLRHLASTFEAHGDTLAGPPNRISHRGLGGTARSPGCESPYDPRVIEPAPWDGPGARVVTAGVILRYQDRFVFQTGFDRTRTALGVVRLGGHVEAGETPWQCAAREVVEEGCVECAYMSPPTTLAFSAADAGPPLVTIDWSEPDPRPLIVAWAPSADGVDVSVTFLAETTTLARPGAETRALLFLRADEVARIAGGTVSLGEFVEAGGDADIVGELPLDMLLKPHGQLKALQQLLSGAALDFR